MARWGVLGKREFSPIATRGKRRVWRNRIADPGAGRYNRRMETKHPAFVPKTWLLPESIRRRLGDEAGRQRLMDEEGHLLVLLHAPPKPEDEEHRHPVVFWRNPEGEWKSYPAGGGLAALHGLLGEYRSAISDLDDRVDAAKSSRDFFSVMREVNPLHRACRNMLGVLEDLRKARPHERTLILLRDHAVTSERAVESVMHDARTGMDFTVAESSETQARGARQATEEARRLNRLVAFFFPIATMVAVFGINNPQHVMQMEGFTHVLVVGVILGLFVRAFVSWRAGQG